MKEETKMEKAVVVSVIPQGTDEERVKENLDELEFLAETAGARSIRRFTQKVDKANSRTYVGSGKLEEIKAFIEENQCDLVLFDDELSPSQLRNLDKELNCRILDRTNLILDIFAQRAKDSICQDSGRTCTIPISASKADTHVDPPRKTAGRHRHERPGRKPDRD